MNSGANDTQFHSLPIETPLGTAQVNMPVEKPVIACILRAIMADPMLAHNPSHLFDECIKIFMSSNFKNNKCSFINNYSIERFKVKFNNTFLKE